MSYELINGIEGIMEKYGWREFLQKYLIMLSMALLPVRSLTQLFILGLTLRKRTWLSDLLQRAQKKTKFLHKTQDWLYLRVVFSLAGGAVFSLALLTVFFMALLKKREWTNTILNGFTSFHIIEHNYLIMLSVALFLVRSLTQLFILGLALRKKNMIVGFPTKSPEKY